MKRFSTGSYALSSFAAMLAFTATAHAANSGDVYKTTGTNDLSVSGNYTAAPTTTSDVQFVGPYSSGTFDANGAALNYGTLDDIDTILGQDLTITNTNATVASITLNTASNSTSGSVGADLLYVKNGASLTLQSGTGTLTLNLANSGNIDDAGSLTISSPIVITSGKTITFTGAGTTDVSGNIGQTAATAAVAVNDLGGTVTFSGTDTYTGTTTVNSGTLLLDFSAAGAPASNILNSGDALTLGGGTFSVNGASGSATSQTMGAVTLTAGTGSYVTLNNNGGPGTTLTLGAITHNTGSAVNFNIANGGTVATATTPTGMVNNVIGYATVTDSTGTGLATYSGGDIVKLTGLTALGSGTGTATGNYIEAPMGTSTADNADVTSNNGATINSLTIDTTNATGANFLDLGGPLDTLALGSGALLFTGPQDFTIEDGLITGSGPNNDLYVHTFGTGTLTFTATVGGGTGALDKDGPGTLVLASANTYTGNTNIEGGVLDLANSNALAAGATAATSTILNLGAGTSLVFDSSVSSNAFTIGSLEGSGSIALQNNAGTPAPVALTVDQTTNETFSGVISGAGSFTTTGTAILTLTGTNTFTGGLNIKSGTVANVNGNSASFGAGPIFLGDTTGSNNATFFEENTVAGQTVYVLAGTTGLLTIESGNNQFSYAAIDLGVVGTAETGSQNIVISDGGGGASVIAGPISGTGDVTFFVGGNTAAFDVTDFNSSINNVGTITNGTPAGATAASGTITSLLTIRGGTIGSNVTGLIQDSLVPMQVYNENNNATFFAPITITLGTLEAQGAQVFGAANPVSFNSAGGTTTALSLFESATTTTVGSLSDANAAAGTASVQLAGGTVTAANTLSIGAASGTTNFGGVVSDGTFAGGNILKVGNSTQSFSGENTYTGSTTISGGVFEANNTGGSATGTGAVTVGTGTFNSAATAGTLAGGNGAADSGVLENIGTGMYVPTLAVYKPGVKGIITGPTTINSGGTLAPGNSAVGTMTVAALTLNAGSLATYEFNATANDFTSATAFTVTGTSTFNFLQEGTTTAFDLDGTYDLVGYTSFTGSTASLMASAADQATGATYSFSNDTTDDVIQVVITGGIAAPEPATWAMMFGGLALLVLVRRRRNAQV